MSKRKLIIILIAIAISLVATLVKVNAADYKVLKQEGRSCTVYAVETYIDIVGNPAKVGAKKAIKALGKDIGDVRNVISYYVSQGAVAGFEKIDNIDEYIGDFPILVITWVDVNDWQDGDITVPGMVFTDLHATVLIEKNDEYYTGVNSWGTKWGYDGLYHLYSTIPIGSAYILTVPEAVVWK